MFSLFLIGFAVFLAAATAPLVLAAWVLRTRRALRTKRGDAAAADGARKKRLRIGFFHPYSTGGGGGERVLWTLLAAVQKVHGADCDITLYTHWVDSAMRKKTSAELAAIVSKKFGITLRSDVPLEIVPLEKIAWVEASSYPRVTLLLQSLGALPLGYEAVSKKPVDVFIDTMGYAFTYPLVKLLLGPVKVVSYTHYPTVSTDMLQAVQSARAAHNNASSIAQSRVMTTAKVLYYRAFALLYGWCGGFCDAAMVNSTWTRGHIRSLWRLASTEDETDAKNRLHLVFPPCDCSQMRILEKPRWDPAAAEHEVCLISVAQFRPEKDHPLQLRALRTMLARMDGEAERRRVVLHLVGGVRDEGDRQRVAALRELAEELGVAEHVKFHVDLPYDELKALLGRSVAGLHTMWNEHFGIGVVEYMASGCVAIAHRSGGPLFDIVEDGVSGYLAETEDEFADAMLKVARMTPAARDRFVSEARQRSLRFTEEVFNERALAVVKRVM